MPKAQMEIFIAKNPLFSTFTKSKRSKIQKSLEIETATFGESLIFQGAPVDSLILIVSGEVSITHYIEQDQTAQQLRCDQPNRPLKLEYANLTNSLKPAVFDKMQDAD